MLRAIPSRRSVSPMQSDSASFQRLAPQPARVGKGTPRRCLWPSPLQPRRMYIASDSPTTLTSLSTGMSASAFHATETSSASAFACI